MVNQIQDDSKFTGVRLPVDIIPEHYHLELRPNFENFTFSGKVSITYSSGRAEPSKSVVLHANELVINSGYVTPVSGTSTGQVNQLVTVTYSKTSETATLEFQENLVESGVLHLEFTGQLNDRLRGFYRASTSVGKTEVYVASTQFAPTDARLCFPCWDEPAIKATFTFAMSFQRFITIDEGRQLERVVISNTRELNRSESNTEIRVEFEKTPRMSTYLLAFSVGPFEYIEGHDSRRPIRVYTTLGKKMHGKFALDVACGALPFFEQYFGVDYPLPKMDLIAVPQLSYGAMENWGLVTFKESALLVDAENTATSVKQVVALVIAHELSHQWFGNLVTMEWWTHLWLNEGFASFMESVCIDHLFREYDVWTQFLTKHYNRALSLDALHSSHPIEVAVNNSSEINEIFDAISYAKGASAIRMLHDFIGGDKFRDGLRVYMNKFAYKNATTEDLWDCLESASNKPVRSLMSGWTRQKGFPWLALQCLPSDNNKTRFTISQSKFSADGQTLPEEAKSYWLIPIKAIFESDPASPKEICKLEKDMFEFTCDQAQDQWVKLNPNQVGLYRVAYPKEMLAKLQPAIESKTFSPMDRFGIQSDHFALCQAGKTQTDDFLKLLQSYKNETDHTVWESIDGSLRDLSVLLAETDFKDEFRSFGCKLLVEIFKKLGWDSAADEHPSDTMTRALVINRLITFGEKSLIDEANRRWSLSRSDASFIIPADLRASVYKAVVVYGDDASFDALFQIYETNSMQEEKNRIAAALGFAQGTERVDRVTKFAMSDKLTEQDRCSILTAIGQSNPATGWNLLKENRDFFVQRYGSNFMLSRIVKNLTQNFASKEIAQEMLQFFKENPFPGAERGIQQAIESVVSNANWLARDREIIRVFLEAHC